MAIGIHKPGHGYWTRVMTAVMGGVVVLAAAGWLWNQAALIPIPIRQWEFTVPLVEPAPAPGTQVALQATGIEPGQRYREIGTAVVEGYAPATRSLARLSVTDFRTLEPIGLDAIQAVQVGGSNLAVTGVTAVRAFDQVYLQGGIAAVVILLGAAGLYFFVGVKRRTVDFLVATDGEMKKVNWSTRKDVIASTWVVIAASIVLAAGLFVVDILFSEFFRLIGVLDT
jgi:preprotein translocase SecE subunit